MVARDGDSANAGRGEAVDAGAERAERLEELVVLVGDIAGEDDGVDALGEGEVDRSAPHGLDAKGTVGGQDVGGKAADVKVPGTEEDNGRGHGRRGSGVA